MSISLTINADRSAMVDAGHPETNYSTGTRAVLGEAGYVQYRGLLVGFPAGATPENQYKRIRSASLRAYLTPTVYSYANFYAHTLLASWAEGSVTFATRPSAGGGALGPSGYAFAAGYVGVALSRAELASVQSFGVLCDNSIYAYSGMFGPAIDTSRSSAPPQLVLTLADEDAVPEVSGAPSGGYVNKHTDITLSWTSSTPWTLAPIEQTDATVRWREGSSGTVHEIGSLGELTAYTLPADSVTGSELQWQVAVTYNSGAVVTTPWYSLSTVEALSTAEIVRPKDTLVDASKPTSLEWRHVIATGTAQTAADLQTSTDGTAWSDLAQISGAANTYVVAAGTWTGGNRWWRVRTYNTDDAAGAWSAAAQISVVGGPAQPVVACTSDPRPVISWQADGQQGYEAEIGGQSSGVVYGTNKRWQPPEFLPDGPATARVRVVNSYGLWSDWGEVSVEIANPVSGEDAFHLEAYAGRDVRLVWDPVSGAIAYEVYRDGALIGLTSETQFTDRASNGTAVWKIRALIGLGYLDSVAVTATVSLRFPIVAADGGEWIELRYSTEPVPTAQTVHGQNVALLSVQGAAYPMMEASPYKTKTYAISAAFPRGVGPAAFEALLAKAVTLKDQYGRVVRGVMSSITTTASRFNYVCSAIVQEISDAGDGAPTYYLIPPTKRYYGDLTSTLDLSGMSVVCYSGGELRAVSPELYSVSPAAGTALSTAQVLTVTVTLGAQQFAFDVSVKSGPVIVAQPVYFYGDLGERMYFTVTAAGSPSYRWYVLDDTGEWKTSGASGNRTRKLNAGTLTETRATYLYRCHVTADGVTVISDAVGSYIRGGGA